MKSTQAGYTEIFIKILFLKLNKYERNSCFETPETMIALTYHKEKDLL